MREDMARLIVERPRIKPFSNRKGRSQKLEDLPTHEGMRRGCAWRGDRKELNENLAPLRRYLESQVGRPWDKVYSEIAAHLRADSAVQQHVRDHLRDFVAITPRRNLHNWRATYRGGLWWQKLYVDPVTGLLCRTDRLPEEKARRRAQRNRLSPPVDRIALTDDCELRLIDGLWYEVRLASLPIVLCHRRPFNRYETPLSDQIEFKRDAPRRNARSACATVAFLEIDNTSLMQLAQRAREVGLLAVRECRKLTQGGGFIRYNQPQESEIFFG